MGLRKKPSPASHETRYQPPQALTVHKYLCKVLWIKHLKKMAALSATASQLDRAVLFRITVIVVNNRLRFDSEYYTTRHCIEMNAVRCETIWRLLLQVIAILVGKKKVCRILHDVQTKSFCLRMKKLKFYLMLDWLVSITSEWIWISLVSVFYRKRVIFYKRYTKTFLKFIIFCGNSEE